MMYLNLKDICRERVQQQVLGVVLIVCLTGFSVNSEARQFRQMAPIPTAPQVLESQAPSGGQIGGAASLNVDQSVIESLTPVSLSVVQNGVSEIVESWNTQGLGDYLDQYFPDRFQLLGTMQRDIPEDASLVLLSVQNVSTLDQVWGIHSGTNRSRISTVIATVNMQIKFVDSFKGLIQLPHTSQFYLRVVESE